MKKIEFLRIAATLAVCSFAAVASGDENRLENPAQAPLQVQVVDVVPGGSQSPVLNEVIPTQKTTLQKLKPWLIAGGIAAAVALTAGGIFLVWNSRKLEVAQAMTSATRPEGVQQGTVRGGLLSSAPRRTVVLPADDDAQAADADPQDGSDHEVTDEEGEIQLPA